MSWRVWLTVITSALIAISQASGQVEKRETRQVFSTPTDAADIWPTSVIVFAAASAPVIVDGPIARELAERGVPLQVVDVGALQTAERLASDGLPADKTEAVRVVSERMQAAGIPEKQIREGWLAVVNAYEHHVERIPAVVFDGNRLVYGVTDLDVAVRMYRRYRAATDGTSEDRQ